MGYLLALEGNTWDGIVDAITSSVSVSTISGVLVSVAVPALGLVFFWWAARKVSQVLFSAFKSGKLHL